MKYWDESSTVAMIEYEVAEPQNVQGPQQAKEKKEKKRAKGMFLKVKFSADQLGSCNVQSKKRRLRQRRRLLCRLPTSL